VLFSLMLTLLMEFSTPSATLSPSIGQVPAAQRPAPVPTTPPAPAADEAPAAPRDPAEVTISTSSAVILVPVKASLTTDYEAAMTLLQGAFSSSTDAEVRTVASSWTVMKATEADSKGNVVYVHLLTPVVEGVDYRPSVWMDRLVKDLPLDELDKYRDALAGPASLLSLSGVAVMSEPPVSSGAEGSGPAKTPAEQGRPKDDGPASSAAPVVRRPGGLRR
jgi:hypothetical protein